MINWTNLGKQFVVKNLLRLLSLQKSQFHPLKTYYQKNND